MKFNLIIFVILLLIISSKIHSQESDDYEEESSDNDDGESGEDDNDENKGDTEEVTTTTTTTTTTATTEKNNKSKLNTTISTTTIAGSSSRSEVEKEEKDDEEEEKDEGDEETEETTTTTKPMKTTMKATTTTTTTTKATSKSKQRQNDNEEETEEGDDDDEDESENEDESEDESEESKESKKSKDGEDEDEDYDDEDGGDEKPNLTFLEKIVKFLDVEKTDHSLSARQKWVEAWAKLGTLNQIILKDVLPVAYELMYTIDISPQCAGGITKVINGLQNDKVWANKLVDSNGHFPSGLLSGTLSSFGDYDQCLTVSEDANDPEQVVGQYCLLKIRPPLPPKPNRITFQDALIDLNGTTLSEKEMFNKLIIPQLSAFYYYDIINGLCVPSSCTKDDIQQLIKRFIDRFHMEIKVENCVTMNSINKDKYKLNNGQMIALIFVLVFVIMTIISTLIDYILINSTCNENQNRHTNFIVQFLLCFSAMKNSSKLFNLSEKSNHYNNDNNNNDNDNKPNQLQFIHGIRVISIIWVIMGHCYGSGGLMFQPQFPYANFMARNDADVISMTRRFITQAVINGTFAVETFFFISGLIVVYVTLPMIKKNRKSFTFHSFILLRWLRFTPLLVGIICLHLLWPLLSSGPMFTSDNVSILTKSCYDNWWANLIYISNWFSYQDQCMIHTWYLSADFQYHILAFFVLTFMSVNYKIGIITATILCLFGILIPAFVVFVNHFPPMPLFQADRHYLSYQTEMMQYKSYNHLTTYFSGLLLGCLLLQNRKFKINKVCQLLLCCLAFISLFICTFITYLWHNLEWGYNDLFSSLYFGFHRVLWVFGLGWICFICATGKSGIINNILSAKCLTILSRLTFSIYLSHMLIVWYNVFQTRQLFTANHYNQLFITSGVYGFSLILAFICHLVFEAPSANIIKLLTTRNKTLNINEKSHTKL